MLLEVFKDNDFAAIAAKYGADFSYNEELFPLIPYQEYGISFGWVCSEPDHAVVEAAYNDCIKASKKLGVYKVNKYTNYIEIIRV